MEEGDGIVFMLRPTSVMLRELNAAFCWVRERGLFHLRILLFHLTSCQICDCVRIRDRLTQSRLCVRRINIVRTHAVRSYFVSFCPLLHLFFGSCPICYNAGAECDVSVRAKSIDKNWPHMRCIPYSVTHLWQLLMARCVVPCWRL